MNLEDRLKGENQLEPLLMSEDEILVFLRDNRCGFCRSHLLASFEADRLYSAYCPQGHGTMTANSYISTHDVDQMDQSEVEGRHIMRDPLDKSEDEILEELGF